jgi:hypothetical protein
MHIKIVLSTLGLLLSQAPSHQPVEVAPAVFIPPGIVRPLESSFKPVSTLELEPYPVAPPQTYSNTYEPLNCTWYVASRIHVPETWGNANTWALYAAQDGYTVSDTPIVGAIAQSSAGYYGHVAIVEAVGAGVVFVSEMNVRGLGVVDQAWYPVGMFSYIYV